MNNKGFTLAELLATIVIMGLLIVGGVAAISSVMNRQKESIRNEVIETVKSGAVSYVQNKKYYLPVCKDSSGAFLDLRDEAGLTKIKNINENINNKYLSIRDQFLELNSNDDLKEDVKDLLGFELNDKCYRFISVKTLIDEGFIQNADDCVSGESAKHQILMVYSQGSTDDPDGAGDLVVMADDLLCR